MTDIAIKMSSGMSGLNSKFGLLPFFDEIIDREVSIFARKNWRAYFQDSKEDFEMEIYIICLNEAEALEQICFKSMTNLPKKIQDLTLEDKDYYKYVGASFITQTRTFLKNQVNDWWEQKNGKLWEEFKDKNGSILKPVFYTLIEKALQNDFTIPQELLDLYNLRHLNISTAATRVTAKHGISRQALNWRRKMWCYRILTWLDNPIVGINYDENNDYRNI